MSAQPKRDVYIYPLETQGHWARGGAGRSIRQSMMRGAMKGSLLGMAIGFVGSGKHGYLHNIEPSVSEHERESDS